MTSGLPLFRKWPEPLTGGLFVSPGYGRHPDRVLDSWELILVRSGCLHIEENGVAFRVEAGESLLMPPRRRHRGLSEYTGELSFYWIHWKASGRRLPAALRLEQHVRLARPERLTELCHQFVADQAVRKRLPLAGSALVMLMLSETLLPAEGEGARGSASLVRKAEEVVSQRLRQGVGPGEVARALGYNPAYLSRLFRQHHGVTLGRFIQRVQVGQARALLQDSVSPLKQIARQCGFRDEGYLRRLFRREMGISPREYRNRFGRLYINRA